MHRDGRTSPRAPLTDVVDGTGAELPVELFGPQAPEVLDGEGPEVEHVVPGEGVSLLHQHHLGPEQSQFDGRAQAAWSSTDDQTLPAGKEKANFMQMRESHRRHTHGNNCQDLRGPRMSYNTRARSHVVLNSFTNSALAKSHDYPGEPHAFLLVIFLVFGSHIKKVKKNAFAS